MSARPGLAPSLVAGNVVRMPRGRRRRRPDLAIVFLAGFLAGGIVGEAIARLLPPLW